MGDRIAASDWRRAGYPNGLPDTGPDTGPCGARVVGLQCGCNFNDRDTLVRTVAVVCIGSFFAVIDLSIAPAAVIHQGLTSAAAENLASAVDAAIAGRQFIVALEYTIANQSLGL